MDAQALGRYLRETRESRELTLEDASGTLHIREDILAAFELGNFSMSGSDVQLRGFLRNYARYLGLNDGQIIAYYQASQQVQPRSRRGRRQRRKQDARPDIPIAPRNITDTPPSLPVVTITSMAEQRDLERNRSNRLLRSLFFGITGLILIGAIGFFLTQIFDISDLNALSERFLNPGVTATTISENLPPVISDIPAPTSTFTPDAALPAFPNLPDADSETVATPTIIFLSGTGVAVELDVTQRMWIRVIVDDIVEYEGLVTPGEFLRYDGTGLITVNSSNAAGMRVTLNGLLQELDAVRGQRADLTFTEAGMTSEMGIGMPPSPTITPSLTATLTLTVTPVPTLTPVPTEGPSPTATLTVPPTQTPTATLSPTGTTAPTTTPTVTSTPSITPTSSDTPTVTLSPVPTDTLTPSRTPTATLSPVPTAILPPRETKVGATPIKGTQP